MMRVRTFNIIHLGLGRVGQELARQIFGQNQTLARRFGLAFRYIGAATFERGALNLAGLNLGQVLRPTGARLETRSVIERAPRPFVVVDTTASDDTFPYLVEALKCGGFAIMSNKKPLARSQRDFDALLKIGSGRLFFETTVGAGLPILRTINTLLATGDRINKIEASLSGTLGFILSQLEEAILFSAAVSEARARGFTEPDPRVDLAGTDAARKALILARLIGTRLETSDFEAAPLYPASFGRLAPEAFMTALARLDRSYAARVKKLSKSHKTLRYLANISKTYVRVGLKAVARDSFFGTLKGPDNCFVIRTERYKENPLMIAGPGAGVKVTAAGVLGDLLTAAGLV